MRSELEFTEVEDVFKMGLHEYLDKFQTKNNEIDNAIFDMYFGLELEQSQGQSMGQTIGKSMSQWMN